jgi:ABC-2 type transport system permease protein
MGMYIQSAGGNTNYSTQRATGAQNRVSFPSMVRGELMKVMWLRSTWIMLAVLISGTAALSLLNLAMQNVHEELLRDPVQYAYYYELSQNLLIFRALSGLFALMVTAFTIGLEYQQGTIRVILGRGVGRVQFLLSKIAALFLMAVLVQLGGIVLNGILLVAVIGAVTGGFTALGVILSHCAGTFLLFFLYLIFNMWVSILLATAATVLGRSLAFGLSIALIWFPLDNIGNTLSALLHNLLPGDLALRIGDALLGPSLNVLPTVAVSGNITYQLFVPFVPLNGGLTIAVVLVYALVFLCMAVLLIRNRDVQ